MPATSNHLLATINSLPIFKIPCQRKYTSVRKANVFRVKFYGVDLDSPPRDTSMTDALAKEGWSNIVMLFGDKNWNGICSLTVVATKANHWDVK